MLVNIDKIKMLCKVKGIKQSYLCEQLGLHFTFLNDVKKGSSPMTEERLNKIAEILDINVDYLKDETEEMTTYKKAPEKLNDREQIALDLFNSLSDEQQEHFLSIMRSLVEGQK